MAIIFLLLAVSLSPTAAAGQDPFKFAILSDLQFQKWDLDLSRLRAQDFVDTMQGWNPAFVVENGDIVQGWGAKEEILWAMVEADSILDLLPAPRYNVIGNHEMDAEADLDTVLSILGMDSSYYSFDRGGYHFIVLNAAYDTLGEPSNWHQGYIPQMYTHLQVHGARGDIIALC